MRVALEWFINPDHLPFIVANELGYYKDEGIEDFSIIEPDEHYDGLDELKAQTIEFATNEPLHLIEQYHDNLLSLGMFFETKGGVVIKKSSYERLKNGGSIKVTTPVSNEKTDGIGFEIIKRFCKKDGYELKKEQVSFHAIDFYHTKNMQEGYDAGWLYFYNFEGVEIAHSDLDVLYMDATSAGFANFAALDIFTTKSFYSANKEMVEAFIKATKRAIEFIHSDTKSSTQIYYNYTGQERSDIMDEIVAETSKCFDRDFKSSYQKEIPILNFFKEIGVSNLEEEKFKSAFLEA